MASKTTNYNLDMPGYDEIADIDVINGNMDKIDVQMKKNADSAQQSKDIVSDEYSATNTYAVGDYCIHENILYKCKTAITTGEAFDSNKWIQTTCGTEFRELNSNLVEQKMLGWVVPEEMPIKNYVDSDRVFHQRVGRVDLSSLDWIYDTGLNRFTALLPGKFKPSNQNEWTRGLYCVLYEANSSPIVGNNVNMTISGYNDDEHLYLFNFSYTDTTTFKNAMQGVYLYYELETPITMTIDGNEAVIKIKNDLGGLSFSVSGTTLSITDGTNTWTLSN